METAHTLEPLSDLRGLDHSTWVVTPTSAGSRRMKRDRTPISRGAQHAAGLGCPRDDPPPPKQSEFQRVL